MSKKKNLTIKETFALAVQNHQKNNLRVAENLYKEVLKTKPNHADAHNNLGNVLQELGEHKKAISCYKKAIQIQPNHAPAYYNIGKLFKSSGEYKKTISLIRKQSKLILIMQKHIIILD